MNDLPLAARNAVVVVDRNGEKVREVFRNAHNDVTKLRNGGPGQNVGKISCMDQRLLVPGVRLPAH